MKSLILAAAAALLLLANSVTARHFGHPRPPPAPLNSNNNNEATLNAVGGPVHGVFQQLIDHDHPELGTFSQRYVWNADFYAGPGSPIILMTPGEVALDGYEGYTTNKTLPGVFAQETGAGVLLLEHRYWGQSSPYDELTTRNLQYLTLDNAVQDLVHFAEKVALPFDTNSTSTPDKAPWILVGCSYSGALSAWVQDLAPGTFWGYHCSSAVVEALEELWQYFSVVQQAMPRNCSADYVKVVDKVDGVLLGRDQEAKQALKNSFGLGDVEHDDDFADALTAALGLWQSTLFSDGQGGDFFQFCDYVENQWPGSNATRPGPEGVGATKALNGFAKWFREISLPGSCASYGYWTSPNETACYDTYNASSPLMTDLSPLNTADRQWQWMLCNEPFKWWQVRGQGDLVSRLVTKPYTERQCGLYFPPEGPYTYGIARGIDTHHVNRLTGGWRNVDTTRLMWAVGELDPWRPTTVVSADRPGGELPGTEAAPVHVIPGAAHCGDMLMRNRDANEGVRAVVDAEVATVKGWVEEFYLANGGPYY